jgi:hypothetical protein
MYGHLKTRQLGNGFKYNENYIHKWRTPHRIDFNYNKYINSKIPFANVVIHYLNLKFIIK